jgi:uncharacterized protein
MYKLPIALIFLTFLISSCGPQDAYSEYKEKLIEDRSRKDAFFKYSDRSPLLFAEKEIFTGLNYFPPDSAFKFRAKVEMLEDPKRVEMTDNFGEQQHYLARAYLHFNYQGKAYRLLAFTPARLGFMSAQEDLLFIPFRDRTAAEQTYEAGRYIEIDFDYDNPEEEVILDFNRAYNPLCIFNENYLCPFPPPENHLDFSVTAGEKMYYVME